MRAGKLRHPVTIQEVTVTNANGEVSRAWATITHGSVRAAIMPQNGREYYQAKQVHADMTHLVRIRYLAGVTPEMRVRFGTRNLNIIDVVNIEERGRQMLLTCQEVQ